MQMVFYSKAIVPVYIVAETEMVKKKVKLLVFSELAQVGENLLRNFGLNHPLSYCLVF